MMKQQSKQALETHSLCHEQSDLNRYKVGLNNIVYQISVGRDGNSWCALLGNDLQDGVSGFGNSIHEALHDLAEHIGNIKA